MGLKFCWSTEWKRAEAEMVKTQSEGSRWNKVNRILAGKWWALCSMSQLITFWSECSIHASHYSKAGLAGMASLLNKMEKCDWHTLGRVPPLMWWCGITGSVLINDIPTWQKRYRWREWPEWTELYKGIMQSFSTVTNVPTLSLSSLIQYLTPRIFFIPLYIYLFVCSFILLFMLYSFSIYLFIHVGLFAY